MDCRVEWSPLRVHPGLRSSPLAPIAFNEFAPGSSIIDTFIGEPEMLGIGHGGRFLRIFARMLIDEGATVVAIDPAAENHHARKAYARAGFVGDEVVDSDSGSAVVMQFRSIEVPGQS